MRLSRRAELLSLTGLWVGSLVALALVVSYAVLPNLPHDHRLSLSLFGGATMDSKSRPVADSDPAAVRTHAHARARSDPIGCCFML